MSRKYPYDTKGENMSAHHYRSAHSWKDSFNGSHEGTLRLINASRSKSGLPPVSEDEPRSDQSKPKLSGTPSNEGAAIVAIGVAVVLMAGAIAAGYVFGRKRSK